MNQPPSPSSDRTPDPIRPTPSDSPDTTGQTGKASSFRQADFDGPTNALPPPFRQFWRLRRPHATRRKSARSEVISRARTTYRLTKHGPSVYAPTATIYVMPALCLGPFALRSGKFSYGLSGWNRKTPALKPLLRLLASRSASCFLNRYARVGRFTRREWEELLSPCSRSRSTSNYSPNPNSAMPSIVSSRRSQSHTSVLPPGVCWRGSSATHGKLHIMRVDHDTDSHDHHYVAWCECRGNVRLSLEGGSIHVGETITSSPDSPRSKAAFAAAIQFAKREWGATNAKGRRALAA